MTNKFLLILSGKTNPYFNMALDEYMIELFEKNKTPVFRIYGWQPSCISLGYNQNIETAINIDNCLKQKITLVRRITGGSAIYHSDEITYSLVMSDNDIGGSLNFKDSYKFICGFIHETYKMLGLASGFSKENDKYKDLKGISNFCFSSWEEYDIVINGKKIGGNAQKRKKHLIFQHGSVPFSLDYNLVKNTIKDTPLDINYRTTALNELLDKKTDYNLIQNLMIDAVKSTFKIDFEELILTETDYNNINELIKNKYSAKEWNFYKEINTDSK